LTPLQCGAQVVVVGLQPLEPEGLTRPGSEARCVFRQGQEVVGVAAPDVVLLGGLGQALAFRVLSDDPATCSVLCDRTTIPAQGFFGGQPGGTGTVLVNGKAPANPKAEQTLQPGDLIEILMPGGGGYGPPAERDPALRERDRLEGYVTS